MSGNSSSQSSELKLSLNLTRSELVRAFIREAALTEFAQPRHRKPYRRGHARSVVGSLHDGVEPRARSHHRFVFSPRSSISDFVARPFAIFDDCRLARRPRQAGCGTVLS